MKPFLGIVWNKEWILHQFSTTADCTSLSSQHVA